MTTDAVTFSFADWSARYPEFATVSPASAQMYFNEATLYCANRLNPVRTITQLTMLLYMVTAHIAALNSPTTTAGADPSAPPGRLSAASEGSASAQFTLDVPPGSAQWFAQTKYGAAYWQATLRYRLSRYIPSRQALGPASIGILPWAGL